MYDFFAYDPKLNPYMAARMHAIGWSVSCPTCLAVAGEQCVNVIDRGIRRPIPHHRRTDLALGKRNDG